MRFAGIAPVMLLTLVAACSSAGAGAVSSAPEARSLTVFAAASLNRVLERVKPAYEAANPGVALSISTDSSAALATQIEQGAPADIFLAADTATPRRLVVNGLTDGPAVTFAGNDLAIIVPAANPAGIVAPADLARPGVHVIAAGAEVPITGYARQLVENLGKLPDAPVGFADAYAANVVSREDNVRAVVARIELEEGDAAIVYATDAAASSKVATIAVPASANVRAAYAAVVVKGSPRAAAARALLDWLTGPAGQAILAESGFAPAP